MEARVNGQVFFHMQNAVAALREASHWVSLSFAFVPISLLLHV
jgi:hypothetical protein